MSLLEATKTPVTILGRGTVVLGIVRSLGRLGIPAYVISSEPRAPAFFSRYCHRKVRPNILDLSEKPLDTLLDIGRRIGKSVLVSTSDLGAVFVSEHASVLRQWFHFPDQNPTLARRLSSKKDMYYLAKKCGVPTAEAAFPRRRQDVLTFAKKVRLPIILKPILNWLPPWDKVIVRTEQELLRGYDVMHNPAAPNMMLQEYIPDEDDVGWIFHGYFNKDSQCLFGSTGKKIRQWPPYHGMTSLGECLPNATLEKTAKRFMKAISYRGIVDIDCRHDIRDDRYKVLDVNPRIGGNFRIFVTDNGMDVARALYFDLTNVRFTKATASPRRKWLAEDLDRRASILYHQDGNLSLSQWVNSIRGVRELSIFTPDDPLPFLKVAALMVNRHVNRRSDADVTRAVNLNPIA